MNVRRIAVSFALLIFCSAAQAFGQSEQKTIDFESKDWIIDDPDARIMNYLNEKSLYLNKGRVYLKNVEFEDGVIEVDVAAHGNAGFGGIVFRFQSKDNYEDVYLRPHKSGLADAIQYTPVFNGSSAWQLYSNKGYTAAAHIPTNRWIHFKIVVSGEKASVYLDNAPEPNLVVTDLKHGLSKGSIGLWGNIGAMNFANFRYTINNNPVKTVPAAYTEPLPGFISRWRLSEAFEAANLSLQPEKLSALQWQSVQSESTGLVNISRHRSKTPQNLRRVADNPKDVVFAKAIIYSDRDQVKKMSFGYSDEVSVFLNNQIMFEGNSTYRFRDPGFLGIVGVNNDAIYLNLRKGENELLLAVTETFGGWGFICKLEDMNGITLK